MEFFICFFLATSLCFSSVVARYPVVIIPGDGGCQLEAKLNKKANNVHSHTENFDRSSSGSFQISTSIAHYNYVCPTKADWYRLWLNVWDLTYRPWVRCWADNIKLRYNFTTGTNGNVPGVETRVPGWGRTETVEYLDPSWSARILGDAGNYMGTLVSYMVKSLGYTRSVDVKAAPFDFRFAPYSQTDYFNQLRILIENARIEHGKPVIILTHSLGGLFGLYFLNQQPISWKKQNIRAFVPLSTPWAGTTVAFNIFAAGYNLGIPTVVPIDIREEQRSYETGAQLLPHPQLWSPSDHVHMMTPRRNFTVLNYNNFFKALNFSVGKINHDRTLNLTKNLTHPGVDVFCVYSKGIPTMNQLYYDTDEDFVNGKQPKRRWGDGDGSVNLVSLRLCDKWVNMSRRDVHAESKIFLDLDHSGTLKSQVVFDYLKLILSSNQT